MKKVIEAYFEAWLKKNSSNLPNIFAKDIIYTECYGPKYFGLSQVIQWFNSWNENGTVLKWEIKRWIEQKNLCVVEWYFECEYKKTQDGFDGVSIVEFNDECKIVCLKEFQSKAEHNYPYGREETVKNSI